MFGLVGWQVKAGEWLIVLAVMSGVAYYIYEKGYNEYKLENIAAQAVADKKQQDKYNLVAQQLEDQKNVRVEDAKTITKVVQKIVTRDVYSNVCLDSDGLSVINASLEGKPAASLNATMPSTK